MTMAAVPVRSLARYLFIEALAPSTGTRRSAHLAGIAIMAVVLVVAVFDPSLAFAQAGGDPASQLKTNANNALSWIWTAVYFILIVAVIGAGVMAAFGRLAWATVGQVLIGAIVAGLAVAVVQALFGNSTNTSFG